MKNILFLGCGKMGSILAKNLLEQKAGSIAVLEKSDKNKISGLKYFKTTAELPKTYQADLVFLAIKPQDAKEILTSFSQAKIFSKNTIFVSILAGKKVNFFENIFGKNTKIIRSMPNLPIEDSQGVFSFFANKNITAADSKKLTKIFEKFGTAFELKDEKLFDAATAIFGSGPAYIFLLQEIFTEIAITHKVSKDAASQLVKQLFLGSALMSCNSQLNFADLRESVTSKGGTTDAALQILQKKSALKNLLSDAVAAAAKRSEELSK
ncbi:MAG: pyrroline-5-carboxylate reductase [Rickettsiales bacterium]|nr:pyrroline-5-carboxylate reductase [Rickettsiales bacterium]